MNSWPTQLPGFRRTGHSMEPYDSFRRTPMEVGPARQRRQFVNVPQKIAVCWRFNATFQMALFEGFWEHGLNGGVDEFTMPIRTGAAVETLTVRFAEKYKASLAGPMTWEVTAVLELRV